MADVIKINGYDVKDANAAHTGVINTFTKPQIIRGLDSDDGTSQPALLKIISTQNATASAWIGRLMVGAENKTFLLGTYNGICGIGAHSWTSAASGTGAAWEDVYFNPDGGKSIYLGGSGWTASSGILKIANTGFKAYVNRGSAGAPNWQEIATTSDVDGKVSKSGDTMTGNLTVNANIITTGMVDINGCTLQKNGDRLDFIF